MAMTTMVTPMMLSQSRVARGTTSHGLRCFPSNRSLRTTRSYRSKSSSSARVQTRRSLVRAEAKKEEAETETLDADVQTPEEEGADTKVAKQIAEVVANPLFYLVGGLAAIKLVSLLGEQVGAIVGLSALPVVGLTLVSKSDAGKKVQEGLEAQLPELQAEAEVLNAKKAAACASNLWFGEDRPKWLGPLGASYEYPAYLKGEVAGDYGFDPLGFSAEPAQFARNYECELLHARWAMLAVVGALIPELLAMSGLDVGEPIWWKVGYAKLSGDLTMNYAGIEGFRIAGKQGLWVIAACQLVLMGGPEYARSVGIKSLEPVGIFIPGTTNYPGSGLFDPLNISENAEGFADQAVKEIKNGRMAMLACLGYAVQAAVTQKGPVENLLDFVVDPVHNNIFAYL